MTSPDYIRVTYGEPHAARGRQMLAAHPELRALAGPLPVSAVWTLVLVLTQCGLALIVGHRGWAIWVPCAYVIGATIDHALWALIHDCTHNLVFRSRTANRIVAIVANVPLVVPGAISFAKYHLLHHRNMGDLELDAGIPGPTESRVVGRSGMAKAAWVAGTILIQGIVRPRRLTRVRLFDGWTVVNIIAQLGCMALLAIWAGGAPFKYLVTSTVFAIGLHPLGARWIQEHFALVPGQETYWLLRPSQQAVVQCGLSHRASRSGDDPVVPSSAGPPDRAGILRGASRVQVLDRAACPVRARSGHHAVQRHCQAHETAILEVLSFEF